MKVLIKKLYPICRSITGDGVRETLREIKKIIPLKIIEIPTGTKVFDWTVPMEWNIRDAYVKNAKGERVIDFKKSNLHVVSYSQPVKRTMSLIDLKKHLHSLPDNPDAIPYKTTYYEKAWGFCLSHKQLTNLKDPNYEVCIDSSLSQGSLTIGEYVIVGETKGEILISTHICHPSLANDNLSGVVVAANLARILSKKKHRYTYRFLFIPGTIGSIAWLATNQGLLSNIKHGLVLTGVGDAGQLVYKKSRRDSAVIDVVVPKVLEKMKISHKIKKFYPFGYDERQYCSPGINLPVGTIMRTPHGTYPQYHTSKDNLDFVSEKGLSETLRVCLEIFKELEKKNNGPLNLYPMGEPNLGRRGLYKTMNSVSAKSKERQLAMLWVLNLADGSNSVKDIIFKSDMKPEIIRSAVDVLAKANLLGGSYES